jgi:hypothetical protein
MVNFRIVMMHFIIFQNKLLKRPIGKHSLNLNELIQSMNKVIHFNLRKWLGHWVGMNGKG